MEGQTQKLDPLVQAVMEGAPPDFAAYLAERGYTNPAQLTLGLLKAYAKAFREGKHLERVNRRTFAGGLPQE